MVIAVIGVNPNKTYAVSPVERAELLHRMLAESVPRLIIGNASNIKVEIVTGYVWRYAMKHNVEILYRGIRSWEKDGAEEIRLYKQNLWGPMMLGPLKWPLPTHFLEGAPEYRDVSSTAIRTLCASHKRNKYQPDSIAVDRTHLPVTETCDRLADSLKDTQLFSHFIPESMATDIVRLYG